MAKRDYYEVLGIGKNVSALKKLQALLDYAHASSEPRKRWIQKWKAPRGRRATISLKDISVYVNITESWYSLSWGTKIKDKNLDYGALIDMSQGKLEVVEFGLSEPGLPKKGLIINSYPDAEYYEWSGYNTSNEELAAKICKALEL